MCKTPEWFSWMQVFQWLLCVEWMSWRERKKAQRTHYYVYWGSSSLLWSHFWMLFIREIFVCLFTMLVCPCLFSLSLFFSRSFPPPTHKCRSNWTRTMHPSTRRANLPHACSQRGLIHVSWCIQELRQIRNNLLTKRLWLLGGFRSGRWGAFFSVHYFCICSRVDSPSAHQDKSGSFCNF